MQKMTDKEKKPKLKEIEIIIDEQIKLINHAIRLGMPLSLHDIIKHLQEIKKILEGGSDG